MRFPRTVASRRWTPLLASLALAGLLCAAIAYWAMQLLAPGVAIAPAGSIVDYGRTPDLAAAGKVFGFQGGQAGAAVTPAMSNIKVLGVAAGQRGSAVLSVDGKPPRPYAVGDAIAPGLVLAEVRADAVVLDQSGARIELRAPDRPSPDLLSCGVGKPRATGDAGAPPVATSSAPVFMPGPAPAPPAAQAPGALPPGTPLPGGLPAPLPVPPQTGEPPQAQPAQPQGAEGQPAE